jgi:histidyl-tRNA synthetase
MPDGFASAPDLFIAPMGDEAVLHGGKLAGEIRELGASVEVAPGGKLKKLLDQANKLGVRYTLIVGENEMAAGRYALKDMSSGEQIEVTREDLIERFSYHV